MRALLLIAELNEFRGQLAALCQKHTTVSIQETAHADARSLSRDDPHALASYVLRVNVQALNASGCEIHGFVRCSSLRPL